MDFLMFQNSEVSFSFENYEKDQGVKKKNLNEHQTSSFKRHGVRATTGTSQCFSFKQLRKGKGRNHTQHSFKGHIYLISSHGVKPWRERASPDQKGRAGAIITARRSFFSSLFSGATLATTGEKD